MIFVFEALLQTFSHENILLLLAQNVNRRPVMWLASGALQTGLVHPRIYSLSHDPVPWVSSMAPVTIGIWVILTCDMPVLPECKPQEGLGPSCIPSNPGTSPRSGVWRGEEQVRQWALASNCLSLNPHSITNPRRNRRQVT